MVRWKDGNSVSVRATYALVRRSVQIRLLLRDLRNVSGLTWATLILLILGLIYRSWIVFCFLALVALLGLIQWLYFRHFLTKAGLESVDEMTGWEFEKWLRGFFKDVGYDVEHTPYQGDFGADFILTWNGIRIAVQAKRAAGRVGIRAVQEAVAAAKFYGCERAMVVTNSYFTDQALLLGRANQVWMRDRDDLALKLAELARLKPAVSQTPAVD